MHTYTTMSNEIRSEQDLCVMMMMKEGQDLRPKNGLRVKVYLSWRICRLAGLLFRGFQQLSLAIFIMFLGVCKEVVFFSFLFNLVKLY